MKRVFSTVLGLGIASLLWAETVILQNGLDGYSGVTDRAVVDTYNFKKTAWWLSSEATSPHIDHSTANQPHFAIAFFTC